MKFTKYTNNALCANAKSFLNIRILPEMRFPVRSFELNRIEMGRKISKNEIGKNSNSFNVRDICIVWDCIGFTF